MGCRGDVYGPDDAHVDGKDPIDKSRSCACLCAGARVDRFYISYGDGWCDDGKECEAFAIANGDRLGDLGASIAGGTRGLALCQTDYWVILVSTFFVGIRTLYDFRFLVLSQHKGSRD